MPHTLKRPLSQRPSLRFYFNFPHQLVIIILEVSQYIYSTGTHKQTTPFQNPGIHDSHKPKHSTAFSESRFFSLVNGAALCNLLLCSYASLSGSSFIPLSSILIPSQAFFFFSLFKGSVLLDSVLSSF